MRNLPDFRPGQDAKTALQALKNSVTLMDQSHHCAVLWFSEIMRRRLHRELGYSTMRAYALEELGFSPTRAGDFIRLAGKLEELPEVKKEMAAGNLGYTKAREIAKVANSSTEKTWVAEAKQKSRRELVATINHARSVAKREQKNNPDQGELVPRPNPQISAAAAPVRVEFELTPGQAARYEAMLGKLGHRGSKAELLLEMLEALLIAPRGAKSAAGKNAPHYQIHVHQCPDCERTAVQTPQGERVLTDAETEIASCDALVDQPGARNVSTIPPRTRREVLARDRHRCRRKGCQHSRYLHIHHLTPRARGGGNGLENLVALCTTCHELWHAKGGELRGMLRDVDSGHRDVTPRISTPKTADALHPAPPGSRPRTKSAHGSPSLDQAVPTRRSG